MGPGWVSGGSFREVLEGVRIERPFRVDNLVDEIVDKPPFRVSVAGLP